MAKYSIFTETEPKSPIAEAYRTLRTNLRFSNVDNQLKTVLFTSAGPSEGKSSTVSNLAVAISQSGKKVLIIDADLRKPTQHQIFSLSNSKGLSTSLVTNQSGLQQIQRFKEGYPDLLTSGPIPPNPSELLGSQRMKQFIKEAASFYDIVLVDTTPTLAVADASILAQVVDGVVIVVGSGEVSRDYVQSAKEQLEKVGANIIGVVLNKVQMNHKEQYYYYY